MKRIKADLKNVRKWVLCQFKRKLCEHAVRGSSVLPLCALSENEEGLLITREMDACPKEKEATDEQP